MNEEPRDAQEILEPRLPAIRKRLREARGETRLRAAAEDIQRSSVVLGLGQDRKGFTVSHTEVRRKEGGDPKRPNTRIRPDYLRAAADAFDVDEADLFAVDVLAWTTDVLVQEHEERRDAMERQLPRNPKKNGKDRELNKLRDRVANVLLYESGIPIPQGPKKKLFRDPLEWIHDDMQRLFWDAFWGRGLTEDELLQTAYAFGRSIPTPARLSRDGFWPYGDLDGARLKRWWLLQAEAFRTIMKPSEFAPEKMNLGRYGEDGYPWSWEEWVEPFDRISEVSEERALERARTAYPDVEPPGSG